MKRTDEWVCMSIATPTLGLETFPNSRFIVQACKFDANRVCSGLHKSANPLEAYRSFLAQPSHD